MEPRTIIKSPARYLPVLALAAALPLVFLQIVWAAPIWQAHGPAPIIDSLGVTGILNKPVVGAIQVVLPHPTQSNTIYAGTVNGGVWKTTSGGASWTPLTDYQGSLSIGALAFDVSNPNRIVAGLAVFSNSRGNGGPRLGLISSNDGGTSWNPLGSPFLNDTEISSLLIDKQTIWAASRDWLDGGKDGKTGLFRSLDGGRSFQLVSGTGGLPTGGVNSLAWDSRNYNRVYAAVTKNGIFRSTNGGQTWTKISIPGMNIGSETSNVLLSVGAEGRSLFVAIAKTYPDPPNEKGPKERLESVWRSMNGGTTWQNLGGQGSGASKGLPGSTEDTGFFGVNPGGQADINLAILADPTNPNLVYIGGDTQPAKNEGIQGVDPEFPNSIGAIGYTGRLFRGDASQLLGQQWTPSTDNYTNPKSGPHADSRWLAFDAQGNLLQVDDGGLYRRTTPIANQGTWQSLNGNLQITEFYPNSIAYDRNTKTLLGGNQDNGVAAQKSSGGLIWEAQWSGDGGRVAINDSHPNFSVRYGSSQNLGNFGRYKVDRNNQILEEKLADLLVGKLTLQVYEASKKSAIPFITPVALNQADKTRLAFGTQRVYLAQDRVNQPLSASLQLTDISGGNFQNEVGALAYGRPGNANILLAGESSRLWLSTTLNVGSLKQLPNYESNLLDNEKRASINNVLINPNTAAGEAETFYVTDGSSLQASNDTGDSWGTGISLPQLTALQFITGGGKNAVVAGGYGTLYASRDTDLVNWVSLSGNLPRTLISGLDYSAADDLLVVGTMGRGAFTLSQASQYIPTQAPISVDAGWLRLLENTSPSQTLNGGILQAIDALNFSKNLTLTSLGGSLDTNNFNCTVSGKISGTGALTKTGMGTLQLSALNTYAGGTSFTQGTVKVTSNANLGVKTGALSFRGGSLQFGASIATSRPVLVDAGGGYLDIQDFTATLNGALSGNGLLIIQGKGLINFNGNGSGFTGALMTHPDSMDQTFVLGSTGRLSGTSQLANFTNKGEIDPGQSPGTFTALGTYTQTSEGDFIAEIASPTSYDIIEVTGDPGTARLAGTLTPKLLNGYLPTINQVLAGIVQTTGGLTGKFDEISNARITRTLFWQPQYNNLSFDLKAIGNYASADLELTANQWAVGNMLNRVSPMATGDLNTVLDTINTFTTNGAVQNALQEVSAQKYAMLPAITLPLTHLVLRQWENRLAQLRWETINEGNLGVAAGLGIFQSFRVNYENGALLASNTLTASDAYGTPGPGGKKRRWGVYLEPLAAWGNQEAGANQVGYHYLNTGFTLGVDYWLHDSLLVGVGTGYYYTTASAGGAGGHIDASSIPVSAYVAWAYENFYLNSSLGYVKNLYGLDRNISFGSISRTATASTDGNQLNAAAETGYDFRWEAIIAGPKLSLHYITLETHGFSESNAGALNLSMARQSVTSLQTGLGGRLAWQTQVGGVTLTPQLYATWQHEFSNSSQGLSASLAPGGPPFLFQTDAPQRDFAILGADLAARCTKKLSVRVGYNAEVGRGSNLYQGVTAGVRMEF